MRPEGHRIGSVDERGVTRDVFWTAEPVCSGRIEVSGIAEEMQVRHTRAVKGTAVDTRDYTVRIETH